MTHHSVHKHRAHRAVWAFILAGCWIGLVGVFGFVGASLAESYLRVRGMA